MVDAQPDKPRLTLLPGESASLLDGNGSSLVMHAPGREFVSQPAGGAGARIACEVGESF